MKTKTIKLSDLTRADLELVAQWNRVPYCVGDDDEKLVARCHKAAYARRTPLDASCVVDDNHRRRANEFLEARASLIADRARMMEDGPLTA